MGRTRREDPLVQFGHRLRDLRQKQGYSQEKLAEVSGLHRTYVGSVERGERNVALRNIVRLAEALGEDPGELIRGLRS